MARGLAETTSLDAPCPEGVKDGAFPPDPELAEEYVQECGVLAGEPAAGEGGHAIASELDAVIGLVGVRVHHRSGPCRDRSHPGQYGAHAEPRRARTGDGAPHEGAAVS